MTIGTGHLWIKICGVRDAPTARCIAELGADAIGINFYTKSPRHVADIESATEIVEALPAHVDAVGVFVNHSVEQIRRICAMTGISSVQLHGDEPDGMIGELTGLKIIRAVRVGSDIGADAAALLAGYQRLSVVPTAWLIDARVSGAYGGTGQPVDWSQLSPAYRQGWPPVILAGGLTPDNVAAAITMVQPQGVDVASGVESSVAVKDLRRAARFISACRASE